MLSHFKSYYVWDECKYRFYSDYDYQVLSWIGLEFALFFKVRPCYCYYSDKTLSTIDQFTFFMVTEKLDHYNKDFT